MRKNQPPVALIVAEHDTNWIAWVERVRGTTLDLLVELQGGDESVPEFAARVRARVATLGQQGRVIASAVWLSGAAADSDTLALRALAVCAVVASMVESDMDTPWSPYMVAEAARMVLGQTTPASWIALRVEAQGALGGAPVADEWDRAATDAQVPCANVA